MGVPKTIRTNLSGILKYPLNDFLEAVFESILGPSPGTRRGSKRVATGRPCPGHTQGGICDTCRLNQGVRDAPKPLRSRAPKRTKKDILRMASRQLQLAPSNASFRKTSIVISFAPAGRPTWSERPPFFVCREKRVQHQSQEVSTFWVVPGDQLVIPSPVGSPNGTQRSLLQ